MLQPQYLIKSLKYKLFQLPTPYTINISATGNSSDSGNGGGSTVAAYQIDCGLDTQVGGTGWGSGTWGRSTWGSSFGQELLLKLALWNEDNFGEDLLLI